MKACRNCVHSRSENYAGVWFERCFAPQNDKIDLVTGEFKPRWIFCSTHREDSWIVARLLKTCGKTGRWFEIKDKNDLPQ
jgi:hypothetical protein